MINYYAELSLDETSSSTTLREKIALQRYQWQARASRAGSVGDKARRKIEIIDKALQTFEDDGARDRYDEALLREKLGTGATKTEIDWVDRSWSYYFMSELGPAEIAARNARNLKPPSPSPYVVSAWIEIAYYEADEKVFDLTSNQRKQHLENAQKYVDEAFVLDELGNDTTEVHHVRGVVAFLKGQNEKALRSYERALKTAIDTEAKVINWRIMRIQLRNQQYEEACATAFDVLSAANSVSEAQLRDFLIDTKSAFDGYTFNLSQTNISHLIQLVNEHSLSPFVKFSLLNYLEDRKTLGRERDNEMQRIENRIQVLKSRIQELVSTEDGLSRAIEKMKTIKEPGPEPHFAYYTTLFLTTPTLALIIALPLAILNPETVNDEAISWIGSLMIIVSIGAARIFYTVKRYKQWSKENEKYVDTQQAIVRMQNDAENAGSNRMQIVHELESLSRQLDALQASCNSGA
ncbi:hypothetical protein [Schaalia cardiffensis]|uniref:hypothetical protein n=1 Tax=Schaalia cardiffensis TaxID=181487 RepID=UPI002AB315CD|nr:hypothetical protein [Schaalia cardiffensis]